MKGEKAKVKIIPLGGLNEIGKNMTALVSAFARCYHFQNNKKWIYKDELASKLLVTKEKFLVI